jgi:uncharacterized protein (DUF1778 family)
MKSKHLTFRCTPEEYTTIKAHCGKNLSQFIVSRLIDSIDNTPVYLTPEERLSINNEISKYLSEALKRQPI